MKLWHKVMHAWHIGRAMKHAKLAEKHEPTWAASKLGVVVAQADIASELVLQLRAIIEQED